MFGLGVPEILIIALIILFIFGAKRLPSIGSGLGETVKEIRNAKKSISAVEASGQGAEKAPDEETQASEETASDTTSSQSSLADSIGKKVTDKVVGQVPGIKQARQWKDKADKIKKFVN
jgi:sec-independent protein translocase protein TatA